MDERQQKMLEATYRLAKENNEYLRKIDRRQRYGIYWKFFTFVIIIGSAFGLYLFLQPYIDQIIQAYTEVEQSFIQMKSIPNQLKDLVR